MRDSQGAGVFSGRMGGNDLGSGWSRLSRERGRGSLAVAMRSESDMMSDVSGDEVGLCEASAVEAEDGRGSM